MDEQSGESKDEEVMGKESIVWSRSPCGGTDGDVCRLRLHLVSLRRHRAGRLLNECRISSKTW